MNTLIKLLSVSFCFVSCASLINSPSTPISVISNQELNIEIQGEKFNLSQEPLELSIPRKKESLLLKVYNDSIDQQIKIDAKNSFAYWLNLYPGIWPGFLIDKNNDKRYTYQRRIFLDIKEDSIQVLKHNPWSQKGRLDFFFTLPHVNSFYFSIPGEGIKSKTGFIGISGGLDFYYSKHNYLRFSSFAVMDFISPFPASPNFEEEYESLSASGFTVSNNHVLKKLSVGYGFTYRNNTWIYTNEGTYDDSLGVYTVDYEQRRTKHVSLGFMTSVYVKMGKHFNLGLIYQPTFLRPEFDQGFRYEHLISLDLAWKYTLKNAKSLKSRD